jgi:hypothetical protein
MCLDVDVVKRERERRVTQREKRDGKEKTARRVF